MRKLIWTYGLIAGLMLSVNLFLGIPVVGETMNFEQGETRGFIMMTLAFTLVLVAIRQVSRRFYNEGISFGKAFLLGLYISLIASIMYIISWEYILSNHIPDFADQYLEYRTDKLQSSSLDAAKIESTLSMETSLMTMYKTNTFYRLGLSFSEIFPIGLFVSLLGGLLFGIFLRKK
jgi:hypothetical protein